jgi:hypothetical protein
MINKNNNYDSLWGISESTRLIQTPLKSITSSPKQPKNQIPCSTV